MEYRTELVEGEYAEKGYWWNESFTLENAPKFLQDKGFDVERGSGETWNKNIKDIYKFKFQDLENKVIEKQ